MKARHIAVLLLVFGASLVLWNISRPAEDPERNPSGPAGGGSAHASADASIAGRTNSDTGTSGNAAGATSATPASGTTRGSEAPPARITRRGTVTSPDGVRRTLVDPMASWTDPPPWPEGPRLLAEVDTSERRYVNLRPDDAGVMPRIRAGAEERLELRINLPEGEPGERIFVEIPNGGAFVDSNARGRVFELPDNLILSFGYITDRSRGHCNVKLRHRGHTRSLPVWVGELPDS